MSVSDCSQTTESIASICKLEDFCSDSASQNRKCPSKGESLCSGSDCDECFSKSGSKPPVTAGPFNKSHDHFSKFAPCGHWSSCDPNQCSCMGEKQFKSCKKCPMRTPYGPYGPWSKKGPSKFCSPKADFLKIIYPNDFKRNGLKCEHKQPMGKLGLWPLAGSCRFAGKPYGPCRPCGPFKSRGPFGAWTCGMWPLAIRPRTPHQRCLPPVKHGNRPCTPCHRPLYRPCKPCDITCR